jgi:hypothetical protein
MFENNGVYVIQLRPETALEQTLLRDIDKAVKGMSEYEYWDIKPKKEKDFMDEGFVYDKDNENPFEEINSTDSVVKEEVKEEIKEEDNKEYVQEEIEWT